MNKIWKAIKKFFSPPKGRRRKRKHNWNHLNAQGITLWTKYISDSGYSDHSCRYKVVEGRTKRRTVQKNMDGHRIVLTPMTQKAVVLVWQHNHPLGGPISMSRYVVHLNKKSRTKEEWIH